MSHIGPGMHYKCLDCRSIGDKAESCACCGSQSIFHIDTVLDRHTLSCEAKEVLSFIPSFKEMVSA